MRMQFLPALPEQMTFCMSVEFKSTIRLPTFLFNNILSAPLPKGSMINPSDPGGTLLPLNPYHRKTDYFPNFVQP